MMKPAGPEPVPGQRPESWDNGANPGYAELCVTSNFTFLTGASHPEELVARAAGLGLKGIAITDRNSLAGVVRAWSALKELRRQQEAGEEAAAPLPRLITGCRISLQDSALEWLVLVRTRAGYRYLSRLLTLGKRRAGKGECHLWQADICGARAGPGGKTGRAGTAEEAPPPVAGAGVVWIALPARPHPQAHAGQKHSPCLSPEEQDHIHSMTRRFPGHVFLGAAPRYDGMDPGYFDRLSHLANRLSTPLVALGDVLMHRASRRRMADVLTCMRAHISIDNIGTRALPNAERRLKSAREMSPLFARHPGAVRRALEIAGLCSFDLSELSYEYPDEAGNQGESPQQRLTRLTWEGLRRRYPQGIGDKHRALADKELSMVGNLGFAAYFLTVHDLVQFARSRGILCQGRGSAANSILCYALGVTDVSPEVITMVFERFISEHRGEPPDIDIDFEHERREEVIQHIYEKYGRHRAGLCATVIHFRTRAAIREVGKVMGLSEDVTTGLSGQIWGTSGRGPEPERMQELGLDLADRRLAQTVEIIREIIGFPRYLSQHVGGFVITRDRLDELCPIENAAMENRTVIEWDKDDIDALGILKVDVLSLGMLTCIRKSFDLIRETGGPELSIATVPSDDTATWDMLCKADAIGVFQVESRAQLNFLPRMQPRRFYDLVIEVAIVRPGPIQGDMVHPYINRRQGKEPVELPSPELREVLGKTLGVPLFQEQAMQIAVVAAGFSPGEADRLRRSLATFRRMGTISTFKDRFIGGMLERGYAPEFAARCFKQIEGFGEYGFPESHAAAFAMLAWVSAWLKCNHPAVFACALLNSQPMGFYAPAQIVRDAREHAIEVRPVCVNASAWDNTLERQPDGRFALRLGFRQIKGMREEDAGWINAARGNGYREPQDLWLRAGLRPDVLERLAGADGFAGMGLSRRAALWQVRAIRARAPLPLFNDPIEGEGIREAEVILPMMHLGEEVVEDYVATRLSLRAHPMELLRPTLPASPATPLTAHRDLPGVRPGKNGGRVTVAGLVITRQRPGTASGVVFLTLEDETGVSNIIVWPKLYEKYRAAVMGGRLLRVTGQVQREGIVVHVIAQKIEDLSARLSDLSHPQSAIVGETHPVADDAPRGRKTLSSPGARHPREQAKKLFPSRDFH